MKDLDDAITHILQLKGEITGQKALITAMLRALPREQREAALREFDQEIEIARVTFSNSPIISDAVLDGLDSFAHSVSAIRPVSPS